MPEKRLAEEQMAEREKPQAEQEKQTAKREKQTAEREKQWAEREKQTVEREKQTAEREKQTAEQEKQTAEREKPQAEQEPGTRERILKAANAEFLEKGFCGASLRKISKDAGVTTGALYRYYDSKEALFAALVGEEAEYVLKLFTTTVDDFEKLPGKVQTESMTEVSNDVIDQMIDYIYDHPDAFRLLLTRAAGTSYEDFIHRIVSREVESTYTFIETLAAMGHQVEELDKELVHMAASGMFAGIFETVVHGMSKAQARTYVSQLRRFYSAGWSELLQIDLLKGGGRS